MAEGRRRRGRSAPSAPSAPSATPAVPSPEADTAGSTPAAAGAAAGPAHADPRRVAALVHQMAEVERELQQEIAGEIDAVLDPETAAPILLRRAQLALARSEARYRDLVTRCPALVCELAPDGTILFVNEAARSILGLTPAELMGRNWWSDVAAPGPEREALRERLRGGDVTGAELPVRAHDGAVHWMLCNSANRQAADDGGAPAMLLFAVDITRRREAQEVERRLSDERAARARAEAANEAKTEFLAVMSHELRTPLNAIAGYTDLLEMGLRGPVTEEQREDLRRIRRSGRHLLGLINDIMNFARLEKGRVDFEPRVLVIDEVLAGLDAIVEPLMREKQLEYRHDHCPAALTAWADAEKVRQILLNLVTNAIKFTDTGGRIWIDCGARGSTVHIGVHDTGLGIPSDKHDAIFEPFVQVGRPFTRVHDGVGLGLSISRELARRMGGNLTVASTPGEGSTFTLTLPRRAPAGATARGRTPRDGDR